jgi:hypothetical protein
MLLRPRVRVGIHLHQRNIKNSRRIYEFLPHLTTKKEITFDEDDFPIVGGESCMQTSTRIRLQLTYKSPSSAALSLSPSNPSILVTGVAIHESITNPTLEEI